MRSLKKITFFFGYKLYKCIKDFIKRQRIKKGEGVKDFFFYLKKKFYLYLVG
jgi:hypothetical protein